MDGQYWINVAGSPVLSFCAMQLKDESSAIPVINFGTGKVRESKEKARHLCRLLCAPCCAVEKPPARCDCSDFATARLLSLNIFPPLAPASLPNPRTATSY